MATTSSTDSGIDIPPSYSTDKEVAIDTGKQAFSYTTDTSKEVFSPTSTDDSWKQAYTPTSAIDSDTSKQAIPSLPPVSMEKEVAVPEGDTDKQLTSTISNPLSRSTSTTLSKTNAHQAFRV